MLENWFNDKPFYDIPLKKFIDELTTSERRPKPRRSVPQVPSFLAEDLNRKMPAQELFGDTDTELFSEGLYLETRRDKNETQIITSRKKKN